MVKKRKGQNHENLEFTEEKIQYDNPDSQVKSPEEFEFFISGLSKKANEIDVHELFEPVGEISSIRILKDSYGNSKETAIVKITAKAEDVISLNKSQIRGKKIRIQMNSDRLKKNKNLMNSLIVFVGNLPLTANEDMIGEFFAKCGEVKEVKIAKDDEGRLRGFCYVEYLNAETATRALELNGTQFEGKVLRIDPAIKQKPVIENFYRPYKWALEA